MTTQQETNEQYHDDFSHVSASMLKLLRKSPRLLHGRMTGDFRQERKAHFDLGTAVHSMALEPELGGIVRVPDGMRRDTRTKAYSEFAAEHEGRLILTGAIYDTARRCVDSMQGNKLIRDCLEADGEIEQSYRWHDAELDIACKIRPDKVIPSGGVVLDFKTVREGKLDTRSFYYESLKLGYHIQQAHYLAGAAHKHDFRGDWLFVFAVVETVEPYRCRTYQLDYPESQLGIQERWELITDYKRRVDEDDWAEENENELITLENPKR